mmetsp:Transcript_58437/g.88126  ORF Transcript_58437/g.88126 Transcript_58437/m.88126 type:complete len:143 (-) Transcript_58437:762-1190(-)
MSKVWEIWQDSSQRTHAGVGDPSGADVQVLQRGAMLQRPSKQSRLLSIQANASEVERLEVLPSQRNVLGELLESIVGELCSVQVEMLEMTTESRPNQARVKSSRIEFVVSEIESDEFGAQLDGFCEAGATSLAASVEESRHI